MWFSDPLEIDFSYVGFSEWELGECSLEMTAQGSREGMLLALGLSYQWQR